jgi:hypothetical protein
MSHTALISRGVFLAATGLLLLACSALPAAAAWHLPAHRGETFLDSRGYPVRVSPIDPYARWEFGGAFSRNADPSLLHALAHDRDKAGLRVGGKFDQPFVKLASMLLLGLGNDNSGTPFCNTIGPTCVYGYSVAHKLSATATMAFQLCGGTTLGTCLANQNIGFVGNLVDINTALRFCASYYQCWYSEIYDQIGSCNLQPKNSSDVVTLANAPLLMRWSAHGGLPVYWSPYVGNSLVDSMTASGCSAVAGNAAKSLIAVTANHLQSSCCGQLGLIENSASAVSWAMFSLIFYEPTNVLGFDLESNGWSSSWTQPPPVADQYTVGTYDGAGNICVWQNGVATTNQNGNSNPCSTISTISGGSVSGLVTQSRVALCRDGDEIFNGPCIFSDLIITSNALSSGQALAAYNNLYAFFGSLTSGYTGPSDLFPTSYTDNETQVLDMSGGWGVRSVNSSYLGPLLNLCQGTTSICEDIKQIAGLLDTTTAYSFCGPSNCTVQVAYGQVANNGQGAGNNIPTGLNMTAATAAERPSLTFGCQVNGGPCMTGNGSQYLCTSSVPNTAASGQSISAVAERTSGSSNALAVSASVGGFGMGFGGANNSYMLWGNGTPLSPNPGSVANGAWHSLTLSIVAAGTSGTGYVDGVSASNSQGVNSPTQFICLFATNLGGYALTGNILEAYMFQRGADSTYAGLSSGNVASLRANQRAAGGF